jgi:hypothetical protein
VESPLFFGIMFFIENLKVRYLLKGELKMFAMHQEIEDLGAFYPQTYFLPA